MHNKTKKNTELQQTMGSSLNNRSVFTKITSRDMPSMASMCKTNVSPLNITPNCVEKLLDSINVKKSTGPGSIPNVILKDCAKQKASSLSAIFQCSIDDGELPDDWVSANVLPIFKNADVHLPENYHSVSLTSESCKILEHIICKHLLNHLEENNILTKLNDMTSDLDTRVKPSFL